MSKINQGPGDSFLGSGSPFENLEFAKKIERSMEKNEIPALSVALVDKCRLQWSCSVGYKEYGSESQVNRDSLMQFASISKVVTAIGVLKLCDSGIFDLDRDVTEYLKGWKPVLFDGTGRAPVTIRKILSHTSGLSVHGFLGYRVGEKIPDLVQILDGLAPANNEPVRQVQAPGNYLYSGGGFTVLQKIIEDVLGLPFQQVFHENVFEPLGMGNSFFGDPGDGANVAYGHEKGVCLEGKWHRHPEFAAAGLWSTPSDIARVLIEVLPDSRSVLLSPKMKEQLLSIVPTKKSAERKYGLGVAVGQTGEHSFFFHGGSNRGYLSMALGFTDNSGRGIVLATNGQVDEERAKKDAFLKDVYEILCEYQQWPVLVW